MYDTTMPCASLEMRTNLTGARYPECVPPAPYALRTYRNGDDLAWCAIETTAGEFANVQDAMARGFNVYFRPDELLLEGRMVFAVDEKDMPVATATAWFDGGKGLLHWVAVHNEHQGRGLARPVIAAAMRSMQEKGYKQAVLHTQPQSWVAIRLYLEFGFRPVWKDDEKVIAGWEAVYRKLGKEFNGEECIAKPE